MVEVDTRCGTIILADRVARRGIAIAAAIFGDDARIERALDLDLPSEMAIEEMVGIGRDHPFGQVDRLDEEEPPEIARRKLARSEERRVGKECVSKWRTRWYAEHSKKTKK